MPIIKNIAKSSIAHPLLGEVFPLDIFSLEYSPVPGIPLFK